MELKIEGYIQPYKEVLGYEYLYARKNSSSKKISSETVKADRSASDVAQEYMGLFKDEIYHETKSYIDSKIGSFFVLINETPEYPQSLKESDTPQPVIYYRGNVNLLSTPSISVVGSRKASDSAKDRASHFAKVFVQKNYAIVTGLAKGIDTAAAKSAIDNKGCVIGVIGTPIDEVYPRENMKLHEDVEKEGLLISQVPFFKYKNQPFNTKRYYFPERNKTMASISQATVIIEASDTSGTLVQARSCLSQKKPLFITESVFENRSLIWPKSFVDKGAIVVSSPEEVLSILDAKE